MTPYTKDNPMQVISLGMGQQSVVLYLMSSMGLLPRANYAVFADTGSESAGTYEYLEWLKQWCRENNGVPIIVARRHALYDDLVYGRGQVSRIQRCWMWIQKRISTWPLVNKWVTPPKTKRRFPTIPAFTRSPKGEVGMLQRQCTSDYKIVEINKAIRCLHGVEGRKRTPPTAIWMGITIDEIQRLKYPSTTWQTYVYPFCNYRSWKGGCEKGEFDLSFRRQDCVRWLEEHGFPIPPKSACFFCPFQSDSRWLDMKRHRPEEWNRSVALDESLRDSTGAGMRYPIYLHHSAVPLEQADLHENQLDLFADECHGVCGL